MPDTAGAAARERRHIMEFLQRRRWQSRSAASLALAGALVFAEVTAAHAGPQHHGTDPSSTGCNANASLISTRSLETQTGVSGQRVEVYYSHSCQTNWIRVTGNPAGGATVKNIRTQNGVALPTEVDYGTGSSYSMQVYAPGSTCIEYQAALKYPDGRHYAEAYDPSRSWILVC
ncbi:DUF2690 domain-containing protein [Microbacterium testaceum]|uniref:DUF2690 domain-containing protein n=1 Tax=Microbacterium testaceum TaxID=2033 RepID=UPI0038FD1645